MNELNDFGKFILADRYLMKETERTARIGKTVVAIQKDGTRAIGKIANVGDTIGVDVDGNVEQYHIDLLDFLAETHAEQMFERVATAIAGAEKTPEMRKLWASNFRDMLSDYKFVPGGRVLAGAGNAAALTLQNCVSAETLIHTRDGVVPAYTLAGKTVDTLSQGGIYRSAQWNKYGVQQLWAVVLKNGDVLYATSDHSWVVTNQVGSADRVTTSNLVGKHIPFQANKEIQVDQLSSEFQEGVRHGFVYGDGNISIERYKGVEYNRYCTVYAFTDEKKTFLDQYFTDVRFHPGTNSRVATHLPATWKELPSIDKTVDYLSGFIAGFIASDGHVDARGSVMLHQSNLEAVQQIRLFAAKCGLPTMSIKMVREFSPFNGTYAPNYKLQFVKSPFYTNGLILREPHRTNMAQSGYFKKTSSMKVVEVYPTERYEEVYCCVEPITHTMVIDAGYLTGQCFVLPSPHDSREGIFKTLGDMAELMSRGGGVGINISTLRPKHAVVRGVNGRSSGAVSWGGLFSNVTGLIEQSGSRRGALMIVLEDWHPDIFEFINSKRTAGQITNANISVGLSDNFMTSVKNDGEWELTFPDTSTPEYDTLWKGDMAAWRNNGRPVKVYKTLRARELWDAIVQSAWESAEPGLWFKERVNQQSNSYYYNTLVCPNPCAEQSLPNYGVCNLGAVNLSKFYDAENNNVQWQLLMDTIYQAVRFLDNVIDVTGYYLPGNAEVQRSERRIGLSTMGLAELLILMGIRYGSPESLEFIDSLYHFITKHSYFASADLAKEKGSFPRYKAEPFLKSGFMKTATLEIRDYVSRRGMRNVTVLTSAPTGTTATMVDTSTGIEPFFAFKYMRRSRLGVHEQNVRVAEAYLAKHPKVKKLPDHFVTAQDLTPHQHIAVQAAIQRWCDSSISKTANVPNNWTVEQTADLYMELYDSGCKGGTIYRDGSRSEQVLMTEICPDCKKSPLINDGGCKTCKSCGYSACDVK